MGKARVLIVDDEPIICKNIARLLRDEFEVVIATDGEDALLRIEDRERFHVIICDVQMTRMSGLGFRDSVRRLVPHLADRIIFLTGCSDLEILGRIDDHLVLTKPFDAARLRELVRTVATAAMNGYFPVRVSQTSARRPMPTSLSSFAAAAPKPASVDPAPTPPVVPERSGA
jgi:CheY-like chemotaxis protein